MNYTIIGHITGSLGYRSYGREPDDDIADVLEIKTFRDKEAFLKAWAHQLATNKYDDIHILLNGINVDDMTDEEYDAYSELETETRVAYLDAAKQERAKQIAAEKERAANAAVQLAREIAAQQRAEEEKQFEMLKRKLAR